MQFIGTTNNLCILVVYPSLFYAISIRFNGCYIVMLCQIVCGYTLPEYIISEVLEAKNIPYEEVESMEEVMSELDVLYMTRVQKERFFNEADYVRLKDTYILDGKKLKNAKSDLAILHPLPRVNEISVEIDDDPRACYFRQVMNGKFVRMALMLTLLKANGAKLNLSADKLAKIPE